MDDATVDPDIVAYLRLMGYRWNEIAEEFDLTDRQLEGWRQRTDFVDPLVHIVEDFNGPNDAFLDGLVLEYLRDCGRRGERFTKFYLQTMGYHASWAQLRRSIWRMDPIGRYARRPSAKTVRTTYHVKGPMHLVHRDGTYGSLHGCPPPRQRNDRV
jgi:hypothetical protein